jgi:hypothetical protein
MASIASAGAPPMTLTRSRAMEGRLMAIKPDQLTAS